MRRLALFLVALTFVAQALAPARARCDDSFDPARLEAAMQDFYDHYDGRNTGDDKLADTDLDRLTRVLARLLIDQSANHFNDVMAHIIAVDYTQTPDDRKAVEKLVAALEDQGRETVFKTEKGAKESAGMTILADTIAIYSVVCLATGVAKSWAAADDLEGFEKFAFVMKNTPEMMPKSLQSRLAIAGSGFVIGSSHAAYDYLYQTRFDPQEALTRVQKQIIHDLAEKAASRRKGFQAALASGRRYKLDQLNASKQELLQMESQATEFSDNDPQYRGQLAPISDDISSSKEVVEKLIAESESAHGGSGASSTLN